MATKIVDGFQIFDSMGIRSLRVESSRLGDYIAYSKLHKDHGLTFGRTFGYSLDDLDFLAECPHVKAIHVQDPIPDHTGLYHLKDLKLLITEEPRQQLDFSCFPKLEIYRGTWSPKFINLSGCRKLKHLALWSFKPKSRDLSPIDELINLE